jgi:hypothetical protein
MANIENLRPIRSEEVAREMQLKSAKKRSENAKERKLIKDRILERMAEDDWDMMIDNLIARAQEDTKSFETLRDTIGEKPKDTLAVENEHIIVRLHHDD